MHQHLKMNTLLPPHKNQTGKKFILKPCIDHLRSGRFQSFLLFYFMPVFLPYHLFFQKAIPYFITVLYPSCFRLYSYFFSSICSRAFYPIILFSHILQPLVSCHPKYMYKVSMAILLNTNLPLV